MYRLTADGFNRVGDWEAALMFEAALICLALNVYHEARDQPFIGQVRWAGGDEQGG